MTARTFGVAAAAAALSTLGLVGCGDEDAPKPMVSDSASQAPSQSSSESASDSGSPSEPPSSTSEAPALEEPTPPPAMEGDDAAAAEAFVEYYFKQATYAMVSGKSQPFKKLALPTCRSCRGFAEGVDYVHSKGGTVEGGELSISGLQVGSAGVVGRAKPFEATFRIDATEQVVSGTGDERWDKKTPPFSMKYQAQIVRNTDRWVMAEWGQR